MMQSTWNTMRMLTFLKSQCVHSLHLLVDWKKHCLSKKKSVVTVSQLNDLPSSSLIVSRFSHLTRVACPPELSLNKQRAPCTDGTSLFESDT